MAAQVPRIFGKLLYGSKFHSLKQSRGQQGIGISAAGMYGQLTTGKPVVVYTRTGPKAPARRMQILLEMKRNEPVVLTDEETIWDVEHGTRVEITLTGSYKRGQHSVDHYLEQTAIANPHLHLTYVDPRGEKVVYANATTALPVEAREIQPHPDGVELGLLARMLKDTQCRNLSSFLKEEFCRVGPEDLRPDPGTGRPARAQEPAEAGPGRRPEAPGRHRPDAHPGAADRLPLARSARRW